MYSFPGEHRNGERGEREQEAQWETPLIWVIFKSSITFLYALENPPRQKAGKGNQS